MYEKLEKKCTKLLQFGISSNNNSSQFTMAQLNEIQYCQLRFIGKNLTYDFS